MKRKRWMGTDWFCDAQYIQFPPKVDFTEQWPSVAQRDGFYSVLGAIGTLSHNHSLNRRRQEQSLIGQEATKVSGQEMKTQNNE